MADTPYPLPRELRISPILSGDGRSVYGPFDFRIFDLEDVRVFTRPAVGDGGWVEAIVTINKIEGLAFDNFTVQFSAPVTGVTEFIVVGERLYERSAGVRSGTQLNPDALERELSKIAVTLQELRRDQRRALAVEYGEDPLSISGSLAQGQVLMRDGDRIVGGPNGEQIANAEEYAERAEAALIGAESELAKKLTNDGEHVAFVQQLNVTPNEDDLLIVSGSLNLPNGISMRAKNHDDSEGRGLELTGSQLLLNPEVKTTSTRTFEIHTPVGSLNKGLDIQQYGTAANPDGHGTLLFNQIQGHFKSKQLGDGSIEGSEGSGIVNMFHVSMGVGGSNYKTDSASAAGFGLVQLEPDTSGGDKLGMNAGVYTAFSTGSRLYGGSTGATIANGGSAAQLTGFETDVFIFGNGATPYRIGFHSWSGGTGWGALVDSAYGIGIRGGDIDGVPVAPWKKGFTLFTGTGGNQPIATDGDLFFADEPITLANIFKFDNVTVTQAILNFPHVLLGSNGALTLGSNVEQGILALNGPGASFIGLQHNGDAKWTIGNTLLDAFSIVNADTGEEILNIDPVNGTFVVRKNLGVAGEINGTVINDEAWADFTPVVSSQGGAISAHVAHGLYKRLPGRTVVMSAKVTLTTVGSATGALYVALPEPAAFGGVVSVGVGAEVTNSGKGVYARVADANRAYLFFTGDASSIFAVGNGATVEFTLTYQAAS
ncbi:hypothetical protein G6M85_17120 [Agrobacterium tumefaciens]|uniref:hypothetical protein n=1 Tax=Agrobacterium tumefaciens TaxID=358 RepID=UPI0015746106|nr:hypothetical protein [Agrobacterium tumefaciens]NTE67328.1 hypothetical protein [Agrobacterium tumefaciens]